MNRPEKPLAHQIYKHFKGNLYQIHCIAYDSETGAEMVVYQALYGDFRFYVRPLDMFMSEADRIKYPDATQKYRFELVESLDQPMNQPQTITNVSGANADAEIAENQEDFTPEYSEANTDPDVVKFWDAETYARRVEILDTMKHKITNEMIDLMSMVIDIEVKEESDPQRRFEAFRDALMIRRTYETSRLR